MSNYSTLEAYFKALLSAIPTLVMTFGTGVTLLGLDMSNHNPEQVPMLSSRVRHQSARRSSDHPAAAPHHHHPLHSAERRPTVSLSR